MIPAHRSNPRCARVYPGHTALSADEQLPTRRTDPTVVVSSIVRCDNPASNSPALTSVTLLQKTSTPGI